MDSEKKVSSLLLLLFLFIMAVGLYGLSLTSLWSLSFADNVYTIIGLFALNGDFTIELSAKGQLNLLLEFSRFLAPLTTVIALFLVVFDGAKQTALYWLRPRSGHVLVLGLDDKGYALALSALVDGKHVIVLKTSEGTADQLAEIKRLGAIVVVTPVIHINHLKSLYVCKASEVFCCRDSDALNIETAEMVADCFYRFGDDSGDKYADVFVHLNDTQLAKRINDFPRFVRTYAADIHFWNEEQIFVDSLLRTFPPERFAALSCREKPHIVLVGTGSLVIALATHIARTSHFIQGRGIELSFVLEGGEASFSNESGLNRIAKVLNIQFHDCSLEEFISGSEKSNAIIAAATQIFLVGDDNLYSFSAALEIRTLMLTSCLFMAPIIYRKNANSLMSEAGGSDDGVGEAPDNIYEFGDILDEGAYAKVLRWDDAYLARRVHEHSYRNESADNPHDFVPWRSLPYSLRESNRLFVDSWKSKLESIAVVMDGNGVIELSATELEELAELEHSRWYGERIVDGWVFSDQRSNVAKRHPLLKHWGELSHTVQQENISFLSRSFTELNRLAAESKVLLAGQKLGLSRVCTIAVTGHRWQELDDSQLQAMEASIDRALETISQRRQGCRFRVVTALAEGADRLVATRAMEKLDAEMIVLLPMPYELYQLDFQAEQGGQSWSSKKEFEQLIAKANWYFELPPIYSNVAEIELSGTEARNRQYAALGVSLVDYCDELIAVWDGQPGRGLGGTADVLSWWRSDSPPVDLRPNKTLRRKLDRAEATIVDFSWPL